MNLTPLRALFLAFSIIAGSVWTGHAQDAVEAAGDEALPAVLDSRVTSTPSRARLVLDITNPTEFGVYTLANPNRLVVELRAQSTSTEGQVAGEGLVSDYRVDPAGPERVRAELALAEPARVQQSYILEAFEDQPARLVIDLIPDSPENFAANVRVLETPGAVEEPAVAVLDGEETAPGETTSAEPAVKPLVVIDPGHGGVDGGARSFSGLEEKHIVLAFALKLQSLLVETGKFDVALTRETDTFLTLIDRVALARTNQADLFISLHADSFDQEDVRGASIYTRGDIVLSSLDRILAENESRVELVASFNPPDDPAVVDVLVDFLGRETRRQSYLAARALIEQLEPSVQLRRFPLRQADFFVLNAPEVPSVLIELGFLSNSDDRANLTTEAWLDRVAAALARGVAIYFEER
ncbi:N-acetylmuramoyl-L-alanine amidase [Pelagibacterium limicola]|uniref:N-acetylmuramoyl-L-alanine amidase n=1 Tax=Pelagibacterium limicola TaxID=2791022 RepID=UPI0018B00145|nr:N-acetylmuramoyl-L-alanine amidase [Pelagibacterium limicola]